MNTSNHTPTILTIDNTNNSTAKVTGIKVTGNRLTYTTADAQGFVELIDSTGSYAAENFIAWVKETVTTKEGTEGALIALVTRYIEEQRGSVELRTFQFNAYI